MHDAGKVLFGLAVFIALATLPFWMNIKNWGKPAPGPGILAATPEIERMRDKRCVRDAAWMRTRHILLLRQWRDSVTRDGNAVYPGADGRVHDMSLAGTCTRCHSNKSRFCDRCHAYAGAAPPCWDCHAPPREEG